MTRAVYIAKQPSSSSLVPSQTANDYVETPITNESVRASSSATESGIIRDDRQPQDQIRTGFEVGGSLNSEMLFAGLDHLILGALGTATYGQVGSGVSGDISLTFDDTTTQNVSGTGVASGLAVGDWIRFEGSGLANDGIVCRIVTKNSDNDIDVDSVSGTLVDGTGTYKVRSGTRAAGGSTKQEFTYVKKITNASGGTFYECLLGNLVNSWSLQVSPNSILTTSFEFLGRKIAADFTGTFDIDANGNVGSGTSIDLPTYTSTTTSTAPANKPFNAISNASVILDGSLSSVISSLQLTLSNNAFGEPVVGVQGNQFVEFGNLAVSGSVEAIVDDTVLYEKFINDQPATVAIYLVDASDQAYIIDLPSVRLNDGGTSIPGQTGSVKLPLQFGAGVDSVTNRAFSVTKLDPNASYS